MKNKCSNCLMNEVCSEKVKELYNDAPCPYFRTEKKYRPFRDTDELIEEWDKKCQRYSVYGWQDEIEMPLIWVQSKDKYRSRELITGFNTLAVSIGIEGNSMRDLFNDYTFLDGSPCGVEE